MYHVTASIRFVTVHNFDSVFPFITVSNTLVFRLLPRIE